MIRNPRISVVMSVYNGEDYLSQAVESILNQTFKDFEFIIVNDGSTDRSRDIIKSYDDDRIILLDQENRGLIQSLNRAIKKARAPLIARMDADDVSLPDRLFVQFSWLNKNADVGVLGTGYRIIDLKGRFIDRVVNLPGNHIEILENILHGRKGVSIIHPTVMMRKDVVLSAGGYNNRFPVCEDVDLWLRISRFSKLHVIPDVLLLYRKHEGNVSVTKRSTQLLSGILARVCYYLRESGLPDPSLCPDDEWLKVYNLAKKIMKNHKLDKADQARIKISSVLHQDKGLTKYIKIAILLMREPEFIIGLRVNRKWNKVIDDVVKSITIRKEVYPT